jgi:hypothetical protein
MYPGRDEDYGLVGPKPYYFLIAEGQPLSDFKSFLAFVGRNDNKIHDSAFIALIEKVLPEEELFIVLVLLIEGQDISSALLVAVRVGKSKLDAGDEFIEHEIEL